MRTSWASPLRRKNFFVRAHNNGTSERLHLRLHVNCSRPAIAGPSPRVFFSFFFHWTQGGGRLEASSVSLISQVEYLLRSLGFFYDYFITIFRGIKTVADTVFDYVIMKEKHKARKKFSFVFGFGLRPLPRRGALISGISPCSLNLPSPARSSGLRWIMAAETKAK